MEDWWLDCVTDGKIEYVHYEHNKNICITLPVYKEKVMGINRIVMPPYTRTICPELSLTKSKYFKRGQNIRHLVEGLVKNLPDHRSFRLFFEQKDETLFAFELEGFEISNQYTFLFDINNDPEEILNNCDQKTRNLIRSTEKKLEVRFEESAEAFVQISKKQRGSCNSHNYRILNNICTESLSRSQFRSIVCYSGETPVASALIVWGNKNMYFWQSARDTDFHFAGANSLLLWEAIKLANSMKKTLDFDSYGSPSGAKFLASFGLPPVPRPIVHKRSPSYAIFKEARKIIFG